ncbi:MAG TPA: DUF305 domain-containing protein [Candidatus Cybelea sp.]|jgi:uncharacterized protein (DUF305 family)
MNDKLKAALAAPLLCAAVLNVTIPVAAASTDSLFLAQVEKSMARMMAGMTIKPSGSVDDDFVASMVPHHQGAIEMAEAELRYGDNDKLRRIAQEIIVTQQQEIAAMRVAAGEPLPPSAPAPDQR